MAHLASDIPKISETLLLVAIVTWSRYKVWPQVPPVFSSMANVASQPPNTISKTTQCHHLLSLTLCSVLLFADQSHCFHSLTQKIQPSQTNKRMLWERAYSRFIQSKTPLRYSETFPLLKATRNVLWYVLPWWWGRLDTFKTWKLKRF